MCVPLCSTDPLGRYSNRTIVLTLPDEITLNTIDWFSVWCVPFRQNFGEVAIPDDLEVPTPPPPSEVLIGSLTTRAHGVTGDVYALGEQRMRITGFNYDGNGPGARFYAVRGPTVESNTTWILPDETGRYHLYDRTLSCSKIMVTCNFLLNNLCVFNYAAQLLWVSTVIVLSSSPSLMR